LIPLRYHQQKHGEKILANGGIICLMPSSLARKGGADIAIAVPVDRDIRSAKELRNVVGDYLRVSEIMSHKIAHSKANHYTDFS
jgi:hypothetical protein